MLSLELRPGAVASLSPCRPGTEAEQLLVVVVVVVAAAVAVVVVVVAEAVAVEVVAVVVERQGTKQCSLRNSRFRAGLSNGGCGKGDLTLLHFSILSTIVYSTANPLSSPVLDGLLSSINRRPSTEGADVPGKGGQLLFSSLLSRKGFKPWGDS